MALEHSLSNRKLGKSVPTRQIFTFFIEDMMFGLDVKNVLMLGQDLNDIQRLPVEERGLCGVVKFQDVLVPVLDYAHRIGMPSGLDTQATLLATFAAHEQDHLDWLSELETCVKSDKVFTKALHPDECDYGKWHQSFQSQDEELIGLMAQLQQPHRHLHVQAEKIVTLRADNKHKQALELYQHETVSTMSRLRVLFERIHDHIQSAMRPVLLYVTDDGKTPRYALMIDQINDVINYKHSDFHSSQVGALASIKQLESVVEGIFTRDALPDCLYIDINKLSDIDQLVTKVS